MRSTLLLCRIGDDKPRGRFMDAWLLVFTMMASSGVVAQDRPASSVVVDAVTKLNTAPQTWVPGTVLSHTDAQLGSEVGGLVTWVADVGSKIEAGERVAQFNPELLRLALSDSQAALRGLEKRLVFLRQDAQRLTSLASVSSAAQSQLDRSIADRDVALEALAQARSKVATHSYRLRQATVAAPFTGQIVERLVAPGEYVSVGQPVVRLVDVGRLEVRSQAPLRVAPFVKVGMTIPVRYSTRVQALAVTAVIPVGDLASRTFELRLKLREQDWVIGTSVQVGLPTSLSKEIVTVNRDALVLREDGPAVFSVADGVATRVPVTTGIGAGERIELVGSTLQIGDMVVVRGAEVLRDGQAVSVKTP